MSLLNASYLQGLYRRAIEELILKWELACAGEVRDRPPHLKALGRYLVQVLLSRDLCIIKPEIYERLIFSFKF